MRRRGVGCSVTNVSCLNPLDRGARRARDAEIARDEPRGAEVISLHFVRPPARARREGAALRRRLTLPLAHLACAPPAAGSEAGEDQWATQRLASMGFSQRYPGGESFADLVRRLEAPSSSQLREQKLGGPERTRLTWPPLLPSQLASALAASSCSRSQLLPLPPSPLRRASSRSRPRQSRRPTPGRGQRRDAAVLTSPYGGAGRCSSWRTRRRAALCAHISSACRSRSACAPRRADAAEATLSTAVTRP